MPAILKRKTMIKQKASQGEIYVRNRKELKKRGQTKKPHW